MARGQTVTCCMRLDIVACVVLVRPESHNYGPHTVSSDMSQAAPSPAALDSQHLICFCKLLSMC